MEKVGIDLFKHKFLKDYLVAVRNGDKILYDASLINTSEKGWILILHGESLMIYGHNWSSEQFLEIKEIFALNSYTNYLITGNSELIYELINFYNVDSHEIELERIFYKTKEIKEFNTKDLNIELGDMIDSTELATMLQQYYHEEYKGLNDKPFNLMSRNIFHLIQTNNIYVLKNSNDKICSFCTIINPDIGILFTKKEYRKKGYGKILLSYCSKILLKSNNEVYLMTVKKEKPSNMVVKGVGYDAFYNYTYTRINNDKESK